MLRITEAVRDQMYAHALAGLPNEACGMISIAAGADHVDIFHAMENAAGSPTLFALAGQEMLDLERRIEETDRSLIGVMHSHTETSAYPSPTDVRDSAKFDPFGTFLHVIVSLRHAEPVVRCFTIDGETITEQPIVIANGDDDTGDNDGTVAIAAVMALPQPD